MSNEAVQMTQFDVYSQKRLLVVIWIPKDCGRGVLRKVPILYDQTTGEKSVVP